MQKSSIIKFTSNFSKYFKKLIITLKKNTERSEIKKITSSFGSD